MALPIAGSWSAQYANANSYVGALKWGTGINPVHETYGEGPPLRTTGRNPGPDDPTSPLSDIPAEFENPDLYGYTMDDIQTLTTQEGSPPPLGTPTSVIRETADDFPPWGQQKVAPGGTGFRTITQGAQVHRHTVISYPTETVTEGWKNKLTGKTLDAKVSSPDQYERQTSMQQVNPPSGRNNDAAVARSTDDPRANILTRLTGMKMKPWSQGERNQDMFPYQQHMMIRPFWYRTAGTPDPAGMNPNEMYVSFPVQRDVPPDPDLGPEETAVGEYGYTEEDNTYA
jgi:hypothetical protein